MMHGHTSILLVVLPLILAPVTAVLPRGRLPWLVTMLVTSACAALASMQLLAVVDGSVISYELGGWAPPWGIEYRIDTMNAFMALIVSIIAAITLPYALLSVEKEIPKQQTPLFYSAFLLCLTGLLGITQTGDIFNLFVFLEISSLSSYALISMGRQRQALTSAYQYLIMGTIGATFFLIGIGLIYSVTGTLNMMDLATRLPDVVDMRTTHTGFAFIMTGFALKLALFPLHLWLPNAYTYAPSVITVFLAATATKVALYVMLRILYSVFPESFISASPTGEFFILSGLAAIVASSISAIYQWNIKRLFAYSSVAQIGYMAVGIGLGSSLGVTASILHLFNHVLMKGALFMAVGALIYRVGASYVNDVRGMAKQMPWTFVAIVIGGLSLIGVPGTVGFISKWYLVLAALEQQAWLVIAVILIGSLIAVVYVGKVLEALYFKDPGESNITVREAPLMLLIPTWVLVIANIYFGLNTEFSLGMAELAVEALGVTAR